MKLSAFVFALAAIVAGALAWTAPAHAEACMNDIDCKTNGTACGTDVCNWNVMPQVCAAAGHAAQGMDGWCTVDTDCKCHAQGAKCVGTYCTFTKAPADGGSGSTSGSGSATSGSATSGATSGAAAGSGAATSGAATSGTGGGSGAAAPASGGSSSCTVGFRGAGTAPPYAVAAMALGACFLVARRRRR
jgi:hypothetical protein